MREARLLHAHVPSGSWSCLSTVRGYLKIRGRRIESSKLLALVHRALMDLERATTNAKAMLQITVQGTARLLDGLKKYANFRQWRRYDRLLAQILGDPKARAARILLYWL